MPNLTAVLRDLPLEGIRLSGGLALRLSRGNGMMVLGISRVGVDPSGQELETVMQAVIRTFKPRLLFQAEMPERRHRNGHTHHIWRLYWPLEGISQVYKRPVQETLLRRR